MKRYSPTLEEQHWYEDTYQVAEMEERHGGSYVRYEDAQKEINTLKAQVELLRTPLRNLINVEHEYGGSLQVCGQFAYKVKEVIFKDAKNALDKTSAQCLTELKAQAGRDGFVAGYHYAYACFELKHPAKNIEDVADDYIKNRVGSA